MKVGAYSAIYGPYDWVKPAPAGLDAVMYTDNRYTAQIAADCGWIPQVVPHSIATRKGDPAVTGPMLGHKWWKTHPGQAMPGYDVAVWLDGSMQVTIPDLADRAVAALGDDDWSVVPHPWRDCAIEEGYYSATLTWRYGRDALHAQTDHYATFHPRHWGLFATGCSVRRITYPVEIVSGLWWLECLNWSHQDQVSLPVLFRMNDAGELPVKIRWNRNAPWGQWWDLHEHGGGAS